MPRRRSRVALAALLLVALLSMLAACTDDGGGGDGDATEKDETAAPTDGGDATTSAPTTTAAPPPELSADEQQLADAIQPVLAATLDDELALPPETATCVAAELVDRFGIDGLAELGVSPDAPDLAGGLGGGVLPEDQWESYADALLTCFGFGEIFTAGLGAGTDVPGIDASAEACIDDLSRSDEWRPVVVEILATGTAGDEAGPALYYEIVSECADTEDYVRAIFANGAEPTALSDCQADVILAEPERVEMLITGDEALFEDPEVSAALAACE